MFLVSMIDKLGINIFVVMIVDLQSTIINNHSDEIRFRYIRVLCVCA